MTVILVALLLGAMPRAEALDVFVLGRYSQGDIKYASEERDAGYEAAATAVIDLASVELRWRSSSKKPNSFNFSGAFSFETMRQVVLDTAYTTPRGSAALMFGTDNTLGGLRIAPMIQAGIAQQALFRITDATEVSSQKISRKNIGVGITLSYRIRAEKDLFALFEGGGVIGKSNREFLEFYGSYVMRSEFKPAADPAILPMPMQNSRKGYEITGGVMFWINKRVTLEARYRMFREMFEWPAANGIGTSSTTTTLNVIDLGGGFRF